MSTAIDFRNQFKSFVASRGGSYSKDHDLRNPESAVGTRMKSRGMCALLGYCAYFTTSEEKENEFRELLNLLAINRTYFFRNEPQSKVLSRSGRLLCEDKRFFTFTWSSQKTNLKN